MSAETLDNQIDQPLSKLTPAQQDRLHSLIEFAQQSARLKLSLTTDITKHGLFCCFEQTVLHLPGVSVNVDRDDDDLWLSIKRLSETLPPKPDDTLLSIWLELSKKPDTPCSLKTAIKLTSLKETVTETGGQALNRQHVHMNLADYEYRVTVEKLFNAYMTECWHPWAQLEKKRQQTIKIYAELFALKQQLEGNISNAQIELVWGVGVGLWKKSQTTIRYPLITQTVELSLNHREMSIEVRPRLDVKPLLELDAYRAIDNLGIAEVQKAYEAIILDETWQFNPFDNLSYQSLLQHAATNLDAKGIYWSKESIACQPLPKVSDTLLITDSWVFFARPRSKSLYIHDLERYKQKLHEPVFDHIGLALSNFVSEPNDSCDDIELTQFRGLSSYYQDNHNPKTTRELFFPLPFNDEQVMIIQRLEHANCVVVQGPPGTGKTHTIANIISHYMALGKKILVTSMKEPALAVLKDKLPQVLQPLAISLLTCEQDGMKQFELAIATIAQELQVINRFDLQLAIKADKTILDELHAKLAYIDKQISNTGARALSSITIDGETISAAKAVDEIKACVDLAFKLNDDLSIDGNHQPQFSQQDIIKLKTLRFTLKSNLNYVDTYLALPESLPTVARLLTLHRQLIDYYQQQTQIEQVDIHYQEPLAAHIKLITTILTLQQTQQSLDKKMATHSAPSIDTLQAFVLNPDNQPVRELLDKLIQEVNRLQQEAYVFLDKPVILPAELKLTDEVIEAIARKQINKMPFGLAGLVTKRSLTKAIAAITIVTKKPLVESDWQYIYRFVLLTRDIEQLTLKWQKINAELALFPSLDHQSSNLLSNIKNMLDDYQSIKQYVDVRETLFIQIRLLLCAWPKLNLLIEPENDFSALLVFLAQAHAYYQSSILEEKDLIVETMCRCEGEISADIKQFFVNDLGHINISEATLIDRWHQLSNQLQSLQQLQPLLDQAHHILALISNSGAPKWATQLKNAYIDEQHEAQLLPDYWQRAWRVKRLTHYFKSIDSADNHNKLRVERIELEQMLAQTYQSIIANSTWLNLANNAKPSVRSALQTFQSAIAKIGKGSGKRAIRYRREARNAVNIAQHAILCWIMPHYRVSESLPAEFGCFDLVIIDEASQSDLTALPAIFRGNKLLIVGDDKQVSPEGIGLEEEKIRQLMDQLLANQISLYRHAMSPERSIYDLCKIVFADSQVLLREHFRSVAPIIEYAKREFYHHQLRPLRLPKLSERLDPPLIDVIVEDGFRQGKENIAEAHFIIDEIKKIISQPEFSKRTIGVVSLLGFEQARKIWQLIQDSLTVAQITQHQITCGDAMTFQGKERDIMFLSMVVTPNQVKANAHPSWAQRFNVAASRARDRMYLVRSIELVDLSPADHLRRRLIEHFSAPFIFEDDILTSHREQCESMFELEMYDVLTERGYRVIPQVRVGNYRIDFVVQGHQDKRLAIECDGDRYHDIDKWDSDMARQRILERAGWTFWRCFASTFAIDRENTIADLISSLAHHGIEPIGSETNVVDNHYCEQRRLKIMAEPVILS